MKDLHINIGGPRDRARQQVSVRIAQAGEGPALDSRQIGELLSQMRQALEQSNLAGDELRRARRHLATIEEEAASPQPAMAEISNALSFLSGLVESFQPLTPLFASALGSLAKAVGWAA
jgi:hypothetical protein